MSNIFANLDELTHTYDEIISKFSEVSEEDVDKKNELTEKAKELLEGATIDELRHIQEEFHTFPTVGWEPFECAEFPNKEYILLELSNLRYEFMKKFFMVGFIGYFNDRCDNLCKSTGGGNDEFTPEDVTVIKRFLNRVLNFNSKDYFKPAQDAITANDSDRLNIIVPQIPEKFVRQKPSVEQLGNITRFMDKYYEEIRCVTRMLYQDAPDIEDAVMVYGTFKSIEAVDKFKQKYAEKFYSTPITIEAREPICWAPFKKNVSNTTIYARDNPTISAIFEEQRKSKLLAEDMLKHRSKKSVNRLTEEQMKERQAYLDFIDEYNHKKKPTKKDLKKYEKTKQKLNELEYLMMPDDAVSVDLFVKKEDGTLEKRVFYTKCETNDEMLERWTQEGNELLEYVDAKKRKELEKMKQEQEKNETKDE